MAVTADAKKLSDALLSFTLEGQFPDDVSSLPPVSGTDLEPAIQALEEAKQQLESEIHVINEETKDDVSSWVRNAKTLQEDIIRSKTIANDIVREAEAPDVSGEALEDAEAKAEFLNREVQYSSQLHTILQRIKQANVLLDEVESACTESRVLDSLRLLEHFWQSLDRIEIDKSTRVLKTLSSRSFSLKSKIHGVTDQAWKHMFEFNVEQNRATIRDNAAGIRLGLADIAVALEAYKEIDERMEQLWHNLDAAIFSPRMDHNRQQHQSVSIDGEDLQLSGDAEPGIKPLLIDLEAVLTTIANRLPHNLLESLSKFMMADLVPRLIQVWLTPAVPSNLTNMDGFQSMIDAVDGFCQSLSSLGYSHIDALQKWVNNAPMTWLGRCRETALDEIRTSLAKGIGRSRPVEKIEKQMVSVAEGNELATTGAGATADTNDWGAEWGAEWDDDEEATNEPGSGHNSTDSVKDVKGDTTMVDEDDGADAWGWGDDEAQGADDLDATTRRDDQAMKDEDDNGAAWGWGDEDETTHQAEPKAGPAKNKKRRVSGAMEETRELVLKETYHISSLPDPVLQLIYRILEDGAILTRGEDQYSHVANTAAGLFSLPTFCLALFRAISPHYYPVDEGGSMYLYNDAVHLADSLAGFSEKWKQRDDLTVKAKNLLRLDTDIKSLRSFANRSYSSAMNLQKTVLRDFLGGAQSLIHQDESGAAIETGIARIRSVAEVWEPILARSVWSQAIGSLAEVLATKIITDVLEMSSISQDEAYNIASLIATATSLDDLFLPSRLSGVPAPTGEEEVPATAQYAPSWLRLKYLSEVLQSNLNEVKFLWLESELSLYFTVGEVVNLIEASFELNPRTREALREIRTHPMPMAA